MFITLELHGIFYHIVHTYGMSTFPNHWHSNPPIFDRCGFAEQLSNLLWPESENPHEPNRIFESTFAYVFILILPIHPGMQNGREG